MQAAASSSVLCEVELAFCILMNLIWIIVCIRGLIFARVFTTYIGLLLEGLSRVIIISEIFSIQI